MEETIRLGTGAIDLMNKEKKYLETKIEYLEAKVESLENIIKEKDSLAESFRNYRENQTTWTFTMEPAAMNVE